MSTDPIARVPPLRERLRAALPDAMKRRDRCATAALRSVLAAIDNAEAVAIDDLSAGPVEASALGPGAAEVPRRELTESDIERIVRVEVGERHAAAGEFDARGRADRVAALRAEAAVLEAFLFG